MSIFGWKISDGVIKSAGVKGSIVRFNVSSLESVTVTHIVVWNNNSNPAVSQTFTGGLTQVELFKLPSSTGTVPDASYALSGNDLDIFVKVGVYAPTDDLVSIAFFFTRNAKNMTMAGDKADCPQEALSLLSPLTLKIMYELLGKSVPTAIANKIKDAKRALGFV